MIEKINLKEKFKLFHDHYNPKIIGELNGQQVKVARLKGPFIWHQHEQEDELFYVVEGTLKIELRDGVIELNAGEMVIIPRGIEHRPVADEEVKIMLFEPATTVNTGDQDSERTKTDLEKI